MASTSKIKDRIADIVSRPHNVRYEEIKWVMDQLDAKERPTTHGYLFKVGGRRLMINRHNNGKSTVPQYSVDDFRDAMIELGLYE